MSATIDFEMELWDLPLFIFRTLACPLEWCGDSASEPATADIELDFCASCVEDEINNSIPLRFRPGGQVSVDEQSPNISLTGNVPGDCLTGIENV
jgi:hypothetical protein